MKQLVFAALLGLAACGQAKDPTAAASTDAAKAASPAGRASASEGSAASGVTPLDAKVSVSAPLPEKLTCLKTSGGMVVIGHRGGPTRDYPANALETLQRTYAAGTHGMEIDVAQSRDGKLYLMHDDDLARATTGRGAPNSMSWAEIQILKLKTGRKETAYHPAGLDAVLDWAVEAHALLELDRKDTVNYRAIADTVAGAHAQDNVIMVAYTAVQAEDIHKAAPGLAIAVTVHEVGQLDALLAHGLKADHLVAWTGTEHPDPALWGALRDRGVVAAFGTLGPRGASLDTRYWEDGDGSEYLDLAKDGLSFLVTDLTDKVSREVHDAAHAAAACGF